MQISVTYQPSEQWMLEMQEVLIREEEQVMEEEEDAGYVYIYSSQLCIYNISVSETLHARG